MKILFEKHIQIPLFKEQFFWKDCSLNFLSKVLPEPLALEIKSLTVQGITQPRKFITYDVGFQVFKKGDKSCKGTGWHVDGIGNEYLMHITGDFRTEFTNKIDVETYPNQRDKLREFNNSIADTDVPGEEIPNATLIQYTSQDIHRGRVATGAGQRLFIRVCNSHYLFPRNHKLI